MKKQSILAAMAAAMLFCSGCAMAEAAVPGSGVSPSVSQVREIPRREAPVLTQEQAQAVALAYLGLEENQITGLKTQLETEDGVLCYDVQFRHGHWEYEFQINAQTGKILSFDRDE